MNQHTYTVFAGTTRIAAGPLSEVVTEVLQWLEKHDEATVRVYDDATGGAVDIDWGGDGEDVLARLANHPVLGPVASPPAEESSGPGRPKLGVVGKEVTLLPRHWEWLGNQRGGASATLRRLVDDARKRSREEDDLRRSMDAAHKFMWDMGGNLPDFEEVSRAFFARRFDDLPALMSNWPADVRDYVLSLLFR